MLSRTTILNPFPMLVTTGQHDNPMYNYTVSQQEAQLMLTTGSTRSAVSRGQQTWYHPTCYI